VSTILRRQGLVLNKAVRTDAEAAPQARATVPVEAVPAIETTRRDGVCSLGLCVLAPLCLASVALLWEGLYAHRRHAEFARRGDRPLDAPYWETHDYTGDCPSQTQDGQS
jgi:hypothetical protein